MTQSVLRDMVYWKYLRECNARKIDPIELAPREFLSFYEIVLQEIMQELNVYDNTKEISITPVTVFTEYEIGDNFGGLRGYELLLTGGSNAYYPDFVDISELPTTGSLVSGTPNKFAIYAKSDGLYYTYLYPLPSVAGTFKIRYKMVPSISAPTGVTPNLAALSISVPSAFVPLLIDGILANLLTDMKQKWKVRLANSRSLRPNLSKGNLSYNLGGLDEDEPDNGYSKNWNGIC